jgi:hypothetical protein
LAAAGEEEGEGGGEEKGEGGGGAQTQEVVSVASGEWGRKVVAEVAACLRAVRPRLLGSAPLLIWTKVVGEVLYQPSLLQQLTADYAHATSLMHTLAASPTNTIAGASSVSATNTVAAASYPLRQRRIVSRVEELLQAQALMTRLRLWAYTAYLVPPNGREPLALAPLSTALQSLCFDEAESVRGAARELLPLTLQIFPRTLDQLLEDALKSTLFSDYYIFI